MHRLPTTLAVAVFGSADTARLLQATRHLDGHLVFRASTALLTDAPLLVDRLGLPTDTLLFTRKAPICDGRDIVWPVPDHVERVVDLRIDDPVRSLARIADGPAFLARHRDYAVPALIMAMALTRLAAALQLPLISEIGIADLLDWLPRRPQSSPPSKLIPPTTMALAFARAATLRKGS